MSRRDDWASVWSAYCALNRSLIAALGGGRRVGIGLCAVALFVAFGWGGFAGLRAWFPDAYEDLYDGVILIHAKYLRSGVHFRFEDVEEGHKKVDVAALMRPRKPADLARLRAAAVAVIWGADGFPVDARPAKIERNIAIGRDTQSTYLKDLAHLASVDAYTSLLEHGLPAEMYHMRPKRPQKAGEQRLVVYLEGHNGPFWLKGLRPIDAFLAAGYHVLGVSMPVYTGPVTARIPQLGDWRVTNHIDFAFFDRPMALYFQPVAEALNQLLAENNFSDVYMVGFSGGGWTATVYAAIDTRISKSYPVSGTYPMYLRRYPNDRYDKPKDWSDFEATYPPLIRAVNYLEFYVLGGAGEGRRQVQILTKYDACCFGGMGWSTYDKIVGDRVKALGPGEFRVVQDLSHAEHKLSKFALKTILEDMARD